MKEYVINLLKSDTSLVLATNTPLLSRFVIFWRDICRSLRKFLKNEKLLRRHTPLENTFMGVMNRKCCPLILISQIFWKSPTSFAVYISMRVLSHYPSVCPSYASTTLAFLSSPLGLFGRVLRLAFQIPKHLLFISKVRWPVREVFVALSSTSRYPRWWE